MSINARTLPSPIILLLLRPRRTHHGRGHGLLAPPRFRGAPTAADAAAQDGEEQEAADAGADADDQVAVVVDPGGDLARGGGAFALSLGRKVLVARERGASDGGGVGLGK